MFPRHDACVGKAFFLHMAKTTIQLSEENQQCVANIVEQSAYQQSRLEERGREEVLFGQRGWGKKLFRAKSS